MTRHMPLKSSAALSALLAASSLLGQQVGQPIGQPIGQTAAAPAPLFRLVSKVPAIIAATDLLFFENEPKHTLTADQQSELVIHADGQLQSSEVPATLAADTLLSLRIRPAAWLLLTAAALPRFTKLWGPRLSVLGEGLGFGRDLPPKLLAQLLAIARDLQQLDATLTSDQEHGAVFTLVLTPQALSNTSEWLMHLVPGERGAPKIDGDAFARVDFDLAADHVFSACEPFLPWLAELTNGNSPAALTDQIRSLTCLAGSGALAIDPDGLQLALLLRDAKGYEETAFAAPALARQQEHLARRRIDVEYTVNALTHRDIHAMKSSVLPRTPTPLIATDGGEVIGFLAVAGGHAFSVAGGKHCEARIKALIDATMDRTLRVRPLDQVAAHSQPPVATLDLDIFRVAALAKFDLPAPLKLSLGKGQLHAKIRRHDQALVLQIQLQ
jgi:hypothetical protein